MGLKHGPGVRHWPLRSVAKKRGPASRISTHGRGSGQQGEAGVASVANQSVYSATIDRRTVMSSGLPPTTQMELMSVREGEPVQDVAQVSTAETRAHVPVDPVCLGTRVEHS